MTNSVASGQSVRFGVFAHLSEVRRIELGEPEEFLKAATRIKTRRVVLVNVMLMGWPIPGEERVDQRPSLIFLNDGLCRLLGHRGERMVLMCPASDEGAQATLWLLPNARTQPTKVVINGQMRMAVFSSRSLDLTSDIADAPWEHDRDRHEMTKRLYPVLLENKVPFDDEQDDL